MSLGASLEKVVPKCQVYDLFHFCKLKVIFKYLSDLKIYYQHQGEKLAHWLALKIEQRLKMENPSFYCLLGAEVVITTELWT